MPNELVTIAFSHYCEKARWALDRFDVPYVERALLPFLHMVAVYRRTGGDGRADRASSRLSTPLLVLEDGTRLHDSADILRWIDAEHAGGALYPTAEVAELERELGDVLGPHARRLAYAMILPHGALVSELADRNVSRGQALALRASRPLAVAALRRALGVTPARAERSLSRVREVADDIAARLADGRPYLTGDRFTAADLTFAALMAPCVTPPEYGAWLPTPDRLDAKSEALVNEMRAHPAGAFALRLYAEERRRAEERPPAGERGARAPLGGRRG